MLPVAAASASASDTCMSVRAGSAAAGLQLAGCAYLPACLPAHLSAFLRPPARLQQPLV